MASMGVYEAPYMCLWQLVYHQLCSLILIHFLSSKFHAHVFSLINVALLFLMIYMQDWQSIKELLTCSCWLHCCSLIFSINSDHFIKFSWRDTGSNRIAGFRDYTFHLIDLQASYFCALCITVLYIIIGIQFISIDFIIIYIPFSVGHSCFPFSWTSIESIRQANLTN